jgi:hypothetical protein
MLYQARRIVTTNGPDGKSRILSDGPTPHLLPLGRERGLVNLWVTDSDGPRIEGPQDGAARPVRLEPPEGGGVFRFFQISAASSTEGLSHEELGALRRRSLRGHGGGSPAHRYNAPSEHAQVAHARLYLLKGRVRLILDRRSGPETLRCRHSARHQSRLGQSQR